MRYMELFPHQCKALLSQGSMKTFELLFYFLISSITFTQLWRNSSQLARLFKVKVALSPDLNTVLWFAKIDLSASVHKLQVCLLLNSQCLESGQYRLFRVQMWRIMLFFKVIFANKLLHIYIYIYIYIYISEVGVSHTCSSFKSQVTVQTNQIKSSQVLIGQVKSSHSLKQEQIYICHMTFLIFPQKLTLIIHLK